MEEKIYALIYHIEYDKDPVLVIVNNYQWELLQLLHEQNFIGLEKIKAFDLS